MRHSRGARGPAAEIAGARDHSSGTLSGAAGKPHPDPCGGGKAEAPARRPYGPRASGNIAVIDRSLRLGADCMDQGHGGFGIGTLAFWAMVMKSRRSGTSVVQKVVV